MATKIDGKDSDVPYERNRPNTIERRFQYATWLVNLDQYSHLPVCATSSILSFTGVHQRQVYIDESGFNIFTRRSKGREPLGERVHRVVAPRGRNVNITLAISPDMGLVNHVIEQERSRVPPSKLSSMSWWSSWLHVYLLMKKSSSSSTTRSHISTLLFHRSLKIDSTWSSCRHIAHFSTPSSKPIAA